MHEGGNDMAASGDAEETELDQAGEWFETDLAGPEAVPAFCEALVALVAAGGATAEETEVAGVDVRNFAGVRLAFLAGYDPGASQAEAPDGKPTIGDLAVTAWSWAQRARDELREAWGEPKPRALRLLDDGESPASTTDAVMIILKQPSAESWERDGLVTTLLTGWKGEPWTSPLQQMFLVAGRDEDTSVYGDGSAGSEAHHEPGQTLDFLFTDSDGREFLHRGGGDRTVRLAFEEFRVGRAPQSYTLLDVASGASLTLFPEQRVVGRSEGGTDGRKDFMQEERTDDLWSAALLFFESSFADLDFLGPWFPTFADAVASPESLAARDAGAFSNDQERFEALGRSWIKWGRVDDSGEYCVFLVGTSQAVLKVERALVRQLVGALGLELVPTPAEITYEEVWVRMTPGLRREIQTWEESRAR